MSAVATVRESSGSRRAFAASLLDSPAAIRTAHPFSVVTQPSESEPMRAAAALAAAMSEDRGKVMTCVLSSWPFVLMVSPFVPDLALTSSTLSLTMCIHPPVLSLCCFALPLLFFDKRRYGFHCRVKYVLTEHLLNVCLEIVLVLEPSTAPHTSLHRRTEGLQRRGVRLRLPPMLLSRPTTCRPRESGHPGEPSARTCAA